MTYYILRNATTTGELAYAHKGAYLTRSGAQTAADGINPYGHPFTFAVYSAEELNTEFLAKGIRVSD
jgi:hypothetical protein